MEPRQRIAIVGSGIAGSSIAWMLREQFRVSLFERNDYFGGHTHTIVVDEDGSSVPVDTGFIVYNEPNYPHLTGLFDVLGIRTRDTAPPLMKADPLLPSEADPRSARVDVGEAGR